MDKEKLRVEILESIYEDYADREDEGVYLERKAGERLYHLRQRPDWAGGADD